MLLRSNALTMLVVLILTIAGSGASAAYRIIWNDDGNEMYLSYLDTAQEFYDERIEAALDTGTQVDAIFMCTGGTTIYSYDTNVAERMTDYNAETAYNMAMLRNLSLDHISATVARGNTAGVDVFWSHRMNDIHDTIDYEVMFSDWKANNPDCLMGVIGDMDIYPQTSPRYWWTALDYGELAVRDYMFDIIEEVCENYSVDGIELDYWRYPLFFRTNLDYQPATSAQLDILTAFQSDIRVEANLATILVAVRIPGSVEACEYVAIDIE